MLKSMDNVNYWLKGEATQNFGDYLAEFYLDQLFYKQPATSIEVFLSGSVISDDYVSDSDKVIWFWGCGSRALDSLSANRTKNAHILAARGPHSIEALDLPRSTPQGDSGFLLSAIYRPRLISELVGLNICIPHFFDDRTNDHILEASGCDFVVRTNIPSSLAAVRDTIDAITSADFVLSASLHGAITAAAYDKPFAFWDAGKIDVPFKWNDLAALLNIP
ncbi:MAG: polysaccharide pyruvyl transferase family protein, partial [Rhizobiales bacterium]|nr:polysaccharide pyruvyl transferase family protein [Hyphomicrobiales bacterium]